MRVTTTWNNAGPHTVWGQLAKRLGREPTNEEAADEVRRILSTEREPFITQDGTTIKQEAK